MKRLITPCLTLALLAGCQGQARPPSPQDPFLFGPTRVPPPGTGAASRSADPYYWGIAPRAERFPAGPERSLAGGTSEPVGEPRLPKSSRLRKSAVASGPEPDTIAPAAEPGLLAGRERLVRILPPRTGAAAADPRCTPQPAQTRASLSRPSPCPAPRRRADISELPAVGGSESASEDRRGGEAAGFRLVSGSEGDGLAEESARVEPAVATETVSPPSRYGHAADYSWVRGKLEHSQIDGRWKLRYIPIDGQTDEYGGSVVVSDPAVLSGCERGEHLELRGEVAGSDAEDGFAPLYEVAEVERLGESR